MPKSQPETSPLPTSTQYIDVSTSSASQVPPNIGDIQDQENPVEGIRNSSTAVIKIVDVYQKASQQGLQRETLRTFVADRLHPSH